MRPRKNFLIFFFLLLLVAAYGLWMFFGPTVEAPQSGFFYVHSGSTYQQLKDSLKKDKIIGSDFWFDKIATYSHFDQNVKAGKYKIKDGMSVFRLVKMLKSGHQSPVNLVITKLRTREDLARKIGENFETDSLHAIDFLNNNDSVLHYNVDTNMVMTIVIPNTYTFTWNTSLEKIFKKLYSEQQKFWNDDRMREAEKLQLTPKQVYILSSIVEEETNKQDDKGKIASVYINRLRKGMKLAADPTIKFAMNDFGLKRIYFKYLSYPSPYNTYLHAGLPPGPINTPSIKTIDAVLNAPETDYLFFVARSDFSGYSEFASNYREHAAFAKAYQQALDSVIKAKEKP
jgi:UPF0755 protein